jgi:hypothetical protein
MTQAYQLSDLGQLLTVDAVGNNITLAANSVVVGNSSVNATINSTAFTGTANNTNYVGTVPAGNVVSYAQLSNTLSNYQTTAGLSANVATLSANNASYLGGVAAASYVNTSGAYTITGVQTHNANLVIGTTAGISANGSFGTANQVLTSNGSTVYWSTVSGGGGGSVNVAAQYTWTNTQTFTNTITFSGSIVANTINATSIVLSTNTLSVGTAAYQVANGNLGLGTSSPAATLDVVGTVNTSKANTLQQTLTFNATQTWDTSLGQIATVTLTANVTFSAPSNLKVGTYILHIYQDSTGGRTATWNSIFKWPAGVAPVLTTNASAHDVLSFVSDGTNLYGSFLPNVK